MKYLLAFIAPDLRSHVVDALVSAHVPGMTISDAHGFGHDHDATHPEYNVLDSFEMSKKLRIEIFCHDQDVEKLLQAIYASAHTGHRGDGKVFVMDVSDALRLKNGEHGASAIGPP
jgi:nitrogen regulatory protein PII